MKRVLFLFLSPAERVSPVSDTKHLKASATVEALLIFPVVVMFVFSFVRLIDVIRIHSTIGAIVNEAGNDFVTVSYALEKVIPSSEEGQEIEELIGSIGYSEIYLRNKIEKDTVYKEISDLSVAMTEVSLDDGIKLSVSYKVSPKIAIPGYDGMVLSNSFYSKCYVGYSKKKENTEYVYITKGSEVYHTSPSCQGLKTTVQMVMKADIGDKRNEEGAKYYACDKCSKNENDGIVYVTPYGIRYHNDANCPNLISHVYKVPLCETGGRRKCFYCN